MSGRQPLHATWQPDNSPIVAQQIGAHAVLVVHRMNTARDRQEMDAIYDAFKEYAARMRVCKPICDYISDKFFTTIKTPAGNGGQR